MPSTTENYVTTGTNAGDVYYTPSYTSASYTAAEPAANLATDTARSNLNASGYDVELTDLINATNRASQQAANASRLGTSGTAIQDQLVANTAANAQGYLDPSTLANIETNAAQQWGSRGFGVDTAAMSAAAERAMGLTSQGLEQQALTNYGTLLADNPSAPIYSMQDLLVSPTTYSNTAANYASEANRSSEAAATSENAAATNLANAANTAARLNTSTSAGTTPTGSSNAGTTPVRSSNAGTTPVQPVTPVQAVGGSGGQASAATSLGNAAALNTGTTSGSPIGSSILGSTSTGYDLLDPTGIYSSLYGTYGSMPNYSTGGFTNVAGAPTNTNLVASGGTAAPANTVYNPATNTYDYNYGLTGYGTTGNTGWDIGSSTGTYPANTYYNAATDQSSYSDPNSYGAGSTLTDYENQVLNDYFGYDYP